MVFNFDRLLFQALLLLLPFTGTSQALVQVKKAEAFLKESKLDSAEVCILQAGKHIAKASPAIRASYYVVNGKIQKLYSEIGKALENYKKAEAYYLTHNNSDSVLLVKTLKAEVFRFGMLEKESINEIGRAERFLKKNCAANIHAYFLNRKLAIYNYWNFSKDRPLLDSLLNEIYALEGEITDYETMAYTINEQGNILEKSVGTDAGLVYYEKALDYAIKYDLRVAGADIAYNVARLYQNKENYPKAIEILHIGIDFAKKSDNSFQLIYLYKNLSHCHQFLKHLDLAILYRDTMHLYTIKLNEHENWVELQKVERRYNVDLKEKELKLKNAEIDQFQSRYWYMLGIIAIIVLIVVILVFNHQRTLRINKKLDKLYKENEFLLREANHRIHNNLQLIIILINSELRKGSGEMENQLMKLQSQVDSIATLHKHLYQTEDKRMVSMEEYIQEIKNNLNDHFINKGVAVTFDIPDFKVPTDQAMQIGLIITELCINTLKHAFSKNQVNKTVHLRMDAGGEWIQISYQDNGDQLKGKEINPKLISQLLRQLKAEVQLDTSKGYHLIFKINR